MMVYRLVDFSTVKTVLDVGSGSGIPGIVIKLFFPNIKLTIVEASHKKCEFMKQLSDVISIVVKRYILTIICLRGISHESFISEWKNLDAVCNKVFHPQQGTPMDELFTRYMYYRRAKKGIKSSTTEALRKFYEKNSYELLKNEETLEDLKALADFWSDVTTQNADRFENRILKQKLL